MPTETTKSLESCLWDAACSIRGAKDAPKFKDYILPLVFTKRLCDVFDDEINRIAREVGSRAKAFMARILDPEPGMECYDPTCGSAGLIIKLEAFLEEKMKAKVRGLSSPQAQGKGGLENPPSFARLKLYGQEFTATTWAMANMNMIIHDMEGKIEIADTFIAWREGDKYSRIVPVEEIARNDYNISPSRYNHTGAADEYRPLAEIIEELEALEDEAKETDAVLKGILAKLTA